MPVHIITDTTAEIPSDLRQQLDIPIVPQYIHFGEETFRDELDIDSTEFYRRQSEADMLPKTSAPPPADFLPLFDEIFEEDPTGSILCVHPSAAVSGTVRSAETARRQYLEEHPEADIRILDTRVVSVGLGLMVLEAAYMSRNGAELGAIMARLEAMKEAMRTFFVVDTLEYLLQGGRIGRASHLVGSLLDIKPILTLADGVVESHSKARTRRRSLERMRALVLESAQALERDTYKLQLGVAHALCEQEARTLTDSLQAVIEPDRLLFTTNGPAIGVHAGPGSLAVSWTYFTNESKD